MLMVAEINEIDELSNLRLLWRDLLGKTRRRSFFQSLDWLQCYWRHYGKQQKLRVLLVTVANRPLGLVPLVVRTMSSPLGPVRVLTYPLDGWGAFYGPLGPHPAATLAAVMRRLRSTRRDWDLIDLRHVDTDGTDRGRTQNAMRCSGLNSYQDRWCDAAVVDLPELDRREFFQSEAAVIDDLKQAEQHLARMGTVEYVRFRPDSTAAGDGDACWETYNTLEKLPVLVRGRSRSRQVDATGETARAFLRDAHARAARAGAVDLNLLSLDGMPVACAYNYFSDGVLDEVLFRCAENVPAECERVLLGRMLRDSLNRGDRSFLFASRDEAAADWQTATATSYRYTHFARTAPRAQGLRLRRYLKSWLNGNTVKDFQTPAAPSVPVIRTDQAELPSRPTLTIVG